MYLFNRRKREGKKKKQLKKKKKKQFAEQFKLPYIETSALNGQNVDAAFIRVVKDIYKHAFHSDVSNLHTESPNLTFAEDPEPKSRCCG